MAQASLHEEQDDLFCEHCNAVPVRVCRECGADVCAAHFGGAWGLCTPCLVRRFAAGVAQ
jgi:hypothetical protein